MICITIVLGMQNGINNGAYAAASIGISFAGETNIIAVVNQIADSQPQHRSDALCVNGT